MDHIRLYFCSANPAWEQRASPFEIGFWVLVNGRPFPRTLVTDAMKQMRSLRLLVSEPGVYVADRRDAESWFGVLPGFGGDGEPLPNPEEGR